MINSVPKFQKSVKVIRTVGDALKDDTPRRVRDIDLAFWSSLREWSRPAIANPENCKSGTFTPRASGGPSRRRRTGISLAHVVGAAARPAVFSLMSEKLKDGPAQKGNSEERQTFEKEELRRKEDETLRREKEIEGKIGPPPEKPIPEWLREWLHSLCLGYKLERLRGVPEACRGTDGLID